MRRSQIIAALVTPGWFAVVGLSGAFVDLGSFSLLGRWLPMPLARGLAIWVAMSWNFALNRRLTFADARRDRVAWQYLLFCSACGLGAVVNWGVTVGLCLGSPLFAAHVPAAAIAGIAAGTVLNYFASRYWVFRAQPGPAPGDIIAFPAPREMAISRPADDEVAPVILPFAERERYGKVA
jgi:putative flippase GtrA